MDIKTKNQGFDRIKFWSQNLTTMGKFRAKIKLLEHIADNEPCLFSFEVKFPAEKVTQREK